MTVPAQNSDGPVGFVVTPTIMNAIGKDHRSDLEMMRRWVEQYSDRRDDFGRRITRRHPLPHQSQTVNPHSEPNGMLFEGETKNIDS